MKYYCTPRIAVKIELTELMTVQQSVLHVHTTYFVKKMGPARRICHVSKGGRHFAVFVRLKRGRVQWALKIEIEA